MVRTMSENKGKEFEEHFKDSCDRTGFYYLRLVDAAKWVRNDDNKCPHCKRNIDQDPTKKTHFTPSNKCDSVFHTSPFLWLLELKSTEGASVSFWPYETVSADGKTAVITAPWLKPKNTTTHKMIKTNQVKSLMEAGETDFNICGFVINFRPRTLKSTTTDNVCYFVHIKDFVSFAMQTGKASISAAECSEIGVEIPCEKLKTRYRYDINKFVNQAAIYYLNKGYISQESLKQIKDWIELILSNLYI